ncbi:hypothetical protein HDE79_003627 [Rhodanobacter sp. MP1X3]|nr:hypothetical protein [Rhodanobacter sp. MP1X3]
MPREGLPYSIECIPIRFTDAVGLSDPLVCLPQYLTTPFRSMGTQRRDKTLSSLTYLRHK